MRVAWAVLIGIAVGTGTAWWLSRDTQQQAAAKHARAERAAAATAIDARPALYRWHDASGVLHVAGQPPHGKDAGRKYERIEKTPREGIEVRSDRH